MKTLIVTRPAAQAAGWVQALNAHGQEALALPLIAIEPLADRAPLQAAWQSLPRQALVVFVSANAAEQFFAAAPAGSGWPPSTLAGATGPGTSAALRALGVPPALLVAPDAAAGRFDSEALWLQLAGRRQDEPGAGDAASPGPGAGGTRWAGRRVLVVRGEDGRDWLADTLRAHGAVVAFLAAYRRRPPTWGAPERALLAQAIADPGGHVWHFSSSEAVGHLRACSAGTDWSRSTALASHPRIAAAARDAGFGQVLLAPPDPAAVAAAVARLRCGPSIESGGP
ncbi:MAG: uroporphyrinogen-III synthase [Burkholderiales bacterium]|nr:uroporphyrinogen-III synthase [Burkholderiales bacterium]